MSMLSYRGDSTHKQRVLARLHAPDHAGAWVARPIHWNGQAGSLVGSLLRGEDLDAWEDQLGLPKWLALALDGLMVMAPDAERGARRGASLLQEIPAGIDLRVAGNRCLRLLLDDARDGLVTLAPGAALRDMLHAVADLHRQRMEGREVAPAQWRKLRRDAIALADTLPQGSLDAAIGACIEAAVWDPATSRTAVSDTLRSWSAALAAAVKLRNAWCGPERDRIQALLAQVYAQAKAAAGDGGGHIDVFKLLEQQHPQDWKVLKEHMAHEHRQAKAAACERWERACAVLQAALAGAAPPLIPRAHLFANPAKAGIAISPDGRWLAWLADDAGVMNLWAAPCDAPAAARQLTFDRHRGLQGFSWTYMPGLLLYAQDRDGDENWRIHGVDARTGAAREFSPAQPGVRAGIQSISRTRRGEVLITLNQRDPRYPDLYLLDLANGEWSLLEENPGFAGYLADDHYRVRLAARSTPSGGSELLRRDADGQWVPWMALDADDARGSGPTHFSADGRTLYFRDSRGRDTAALVAIDMDSGHGTTLAQDARADIGGTIVDPLDYRPLAYAVTCERHRLHVLDDCIRGDIDFLDGQDIGEWHLGSRTEDDRQWLVGASSDVRPDAVYLYDRPARTLTKLLDLRPQLAGARLARMQSTVIEARDGLKLVSYLSLPAEADLGDLQARQPLPLVLLVHGGPWTRDYFGYNAMHQWLANRGYAVLSVNFRGSTGFGKAFTAAGDGEWGRKMDEDLDDAVQWAIDRGIADTERLAMFGASYGGYAVLSALTRYAGRYACAIDVVGPSNLETLLASIPPYWEAARAMQYRAIGNPETEEGRALLRERSPLHRATAVSAPLLIAQGANDPRVRQAEAEQMVAALKRNGIPVTYALYPDEGHGFVREANRMSFNALCESFLARYLDGREEPWSLADFPGTSLRIVEDDERSEA